MKRVLALLLFSFFLSYHALAPAASWIEVRSPHFILKYQTPEHKAASFLLEKAEEAREAIGKDIRHLPPSPTLVYLAPTWEALQGVQPGGQPPSWSVGTAYPAHNLICLRSPRGVRGGRTAIEEVFQHEYAHLALAHALRGNEAPQWLDEGFAMLRSRGWNLSWDYIMSRGVLAKELIPLGELVDSFPPDERRAELAYAQSFSFVSYIKNKFGPEALPRLVQGLSHGLDADTALTVATGLGLKNLERRWKEDLKRRYSWIPVVTSFFSLWFLASLLFLLGYWLKRRRAKRTLAQWEREEALTNDLPPPESPGEGDGHKSSS